MSNGLFAPSCEQLGLFHCEETGVEAVSLFDGEVKHAHEPDDQMKKFIPKGTY